LLPGGGRAHAHAAGVSLFQACTRPIPLATHACLAHPTDSASLYLHLDNLDYNSLKHEIKVHTMRDQATAIAIPGHRDTALQKFEDGLYLELCRQHDRVGMFINSKADEISRRLGMCVT